MQCVILAGGRGTRMDSLTAGIPKALIPVNGQPFLDHQFRYLAKSGVTDVVMSIGYKGKLIREFAKDGQAWGLTLRYVDEGENLRGTGGALKLALEQGALEPAFLMTWGDAFLPIDFSRVWEYFQDIQEPVLMTVFKNNHRWGPSNVIFDGTKVTRYDKAAGARKDPAMQYLDYGVSAFRRSVVEKDIPAGSSDLADVMSALSLRGDIAGTEVTTRFYEIGSPAGLRDLSDFLAKHDL